VHNLNTINNNIITTVDIHVHRDRSWQSDISMRTSASGGVLMERPPGEALCTKHAGLSPGGSASVEVLSGALISCGICRISSSQLQAMVQDRCLRVCDCFGYLYSRSWEKQRKSYY
jgi:hypothetical protein